MRRFTWFLAIVLFSLITTACASGGAQPAPESAPGLASPSSAVTLADVATATPLPPTATPVAPTSASVMEVANPLPATATPVAPTSAPASEVATPLPVTATPEPAPGSASAVATDTPTSVPAPAAPAPPPIQVPAPKLVGFDGLTFSWEWGGLDVMDDEDWYFDIKIFYNVFTEYPYNVFVAELENTTHAGGVWSFGGTADFECGSFWAVQIAKHNPDGSYGGPLSPESDRLPVNQGCAGGEEDPCPDCG